MSAESATQLLNGPSKKFLVNLSSKEEIKFYEASLLFFDPSLPTWTHLINFKHVSKRITGTRIFAYFKLGVCKIFKGCMFQSFHRCACFFLLPLLLASKLSTVLVWAFPVWSLILIFSHCKFLSLYVHWILNYKNNLIIKV